MANSNPLNAVRSQDTINNGLVELDIFSGRPNPTWTLLTLELEPLIEVVNQLPVIETQKMFEGLGYKGFWVYVTDPEKEQSTIWHVQGSVLQIELDGAISYKRDESRHLEKTLLESGKSHLDKILFEELERIIIGP